MHEWPGESLGTPPPQNLGKVRISEYLHRSRKKQYCSTSEMPITSGLFAPVDEVYPGMFEGKQRFFGIVFEDFSEFRILP